MTLKMRLLAIVAVPLLAAIVFTGIREVREVDRLVEQRDLAEKLVLGDHVSDLIHQLQRERSYTVGMVSSDGARFASDVTAQRSATDSQLKAAARALDLFEAAGATRVADFRTDIGLLPGMRDGASRMTLTPPELAAFYSGAIDHLIRSLESILIRVKDPETLDAARIFGALIAAKEQAELERLMGAEGFDAGRFTPDLLARFAQFSGGGEALLAEAANTDQRRIADIIDRMDESPEHAEIKRLRNLAPASVLESDAAGMDTGVWLDTSRAWVDRIRTAELEIRDLMKDMSSTAIEETTFVVLLQAALMLFITIGASGWALHSAGKLKDETTSLSEELERVADGDLEERKETRLRTPEFIAIQKMTRTFRKNAIDRLEAQAARDAHQLILDDVVEKLTLGLAQLSRGDLDAEISRPFEAPYDPLRNDFNGALRNLKVLISELADGLHALDKNANAVRTASHRLAKRTETQAATLDASARSARELRKLVEGTAESARKTEHFVVDTRAKAESGADVVSHAVKAMGQIESSSEEISRIVAVIEDIAFQTNLLALNAGVEAARAGDAGRGFAIVASEVRGLAQRASESAREIRELIRKSAEDVGAGVRLVRSTGDSFSEILTGVTKIGEFTADISGASRDQADAVAGLATSIEAIDEATQSNAAMAEEMTAAAATLFEETQKLNAAAGVFDPDNHVEKRGGDRDAFA